MQNKREQLERRRHIALFKRDYLLTNLHYDINALTDKIRVLEANPRAAERVKILRDHLRDTRRRQRDLLEFAV